MVVLYSSSQILHNPMDCSLCSGNLPGKNTGAVGHFLLWGIFPTQGLNLLLLYWQADSLLLCHLKPLTKWHFKVMRQYILAFLLILGGGKALSLSPLSMIFSFKVFIDALFQAEELLFLFCRKFLLE